MLGPDLLMVDNAAFKNGYENLLTICTANTVQDSERAISCLSTQTGHDFHGPIRPDRS